MSGHVHRHVLTSTGVKVHVFKEGTERQHHDKTACGVVVNTLFGLPDITNKPVNCSRCWPYDRACRS